MLASDLAAPQVRPQWRLANLAEAEEAAFHAAASAYYEAVTTEMIYDQAVEALEVTLATAEAATSPDEKLAIPAQEVVNARVGRDDALTAYTAAMATLAEATAAYEAALPKDPLVSIIERIDILEAAEPPISPDAERIDILEVDTNILMAVIEILCPRLDEVRYEEVCGEFMP